MIPSIIPSWFVELYDSGVKFIYVSDFPGDVRVSLNTNEPRLKTIANTAGRLSFRRWPGLIVVSATDRHDQKAASFSPFLRDGKVASINHTVPDRLEFEAGGLGGDPRGETPLLMVCAPPNSYVLLGRGITGDVYNGHRLGIVYTVPLGYRPPVQQVLHV